LGFGLFVMAGLQTWYGLGPLRRVRLAIQRMREGGASRVTDPLPLEVQPLVQEINALLEHSERQAEEARTHAGNLAHALKTPLTVVMNAATAKAARSCRYRDPRGCGHAPSGRSPLARARAVGRRAVGHSRAPGVAKVSRPCCVRSPVFTRCGFDMDGNRAAEVAIERQDLDEVLGNLIENAAKYGGGSVFVTIDAVPGDPKFCEIWIEDDGMGIPETNASAFSIAAHGSIPASPARGWALPSCATWPKSMAAALNCARVMIWAGLCRSCDCQDL
jgi:signal transduction histidine kinase